MRIVGINKIKSGDILGKSLFNAQQDLVVESGCVLTDDMINLIQRRGYRYVYIMDELSKDIIPEQVLSDTVRDITQKNLADKFAEARQAIASESFNPEKIREKITGGNGDRPLIEMPTMRNLVSNLLEEIMEAGISIFSALPDQGGGSSAHQHALDTALLSILIGQKFSFSSTELKQLGTAALMHDIGKLSFPSIVKKSYNEQTRDERMIMREHPVFSMLILRGSDENSFIEQVAVLQHHERQDGRGYPNGIKGSQLPPTVANKRQKNQIHRFAEIIGVANTYDNLVKGTWDGTEREPAEALAFLVNDMTGAFNKHILKVMPSLVQCYPTGTMVRIVKTASGDLSGWYGVIARTNPDDLTKPIILLTHDANGTEIKPRTVDISTESEVKLDLIL